MRKRRTLGLVIPILTVATISVGLAPLSLGPDGDPAAEAGTSSDPVPEPIWNARTDDYLAWATTQGLSPGSVMSVVAHAERHRRDPSYVWDSTAPDPSDYEARFEQLRQFKDTGDFSINDYLFALLGYRDQLRPELAAAFEERVLAFKYWWTEPTPPGIVDSQYYWTENHLIIFLANELIAGQTYPDSVFTNAQMTGRDHVAHATPLIKRWMSLRARFGFSEWLSNVYWMEDLKGLLLLAEWSNDADIARWASALLDIMFVELASHLQNGSFGATHGRSYLKDKMTARDEDTYTLAEMVLDDAPTGYLHVDLTTVVAAARRYRPPEAARRIATAGDSAAVMQRQGIPIDPHEPISPNPSPAYGLPYDDALVWWGMGAQFPWQVVPLSVDMINRYDLFETDNFQTAIALKPIVENGSVPDLQQLALLLAAPVNAGLLSEVNTYTWRSPDVMLSTAQDWRKGQRSEQVHVSQATLDPDALVFTTHPAKGPPVDAADARDDGSFYWTGQAAAPRSVQNERVNISIYSPQYDSDPASPIPYLRYENMTHAFFPTERFDEVVEQNGWVFGRKGDGYVALWSWRPAHWKTYGPGEYALGLTQPFDLVAQGGPDNVWITEVGRRADWAANPDPFAAFVAAVSSSNPTVTPLPSSGGPHTIKDGFDIVYQSPSAGPLSVGWDQPFVVNGAPQQLSQYPRWDSPWAHVDFDTWRYTVTIDGVGIDHDLTDLAQLTLSTPPPSSTTTSSPLRGPGGSAGSPPGATRATPRFTG